MIKIPLRNRAGAVVAHALVDAADVQLSQLSWYRAKDGYVCRSLPGGGKELLHRAVMGCTAGDGKIVDHKDRDKLNCRRYNLRLMPDQRTSKHNVPARGRYPRGVKLTRSGRYEAMVGKDGKKHYIGLFDTPEAAGEAAKAFRLQHLVGALD